MAPSLFDVYHQLTFYGSYHANKWNVLIHILCVPWLLWSFQALLANTPLPQFIPKFQYVFNDYLALDLNFSLIFSAFYLAYYYILDPIAAFIYTPQMVFSLLTATAFSHTSSGIYKSGIVNGICWVLQFIGHGVAEKRSPALIDNIVGAFVLAPFFVHLEILFKLGYRPEMHRRLQNDIGKEITRIRKISGDKRRAAETKSE